MSESPPISLEEARTAFTRHLERVARLLFALACGIGLARIVGETFLAVGAGRTIGFVQAVRDALPRTILSSALLAVATRLLSLPLLRMLYAGLLQRGQLAPAARAGGNVPLDEPLLGDEEGAEAAGAFLATLGTWVPSRLVRYRLPPDGEEKTGVLFANQRPLAQPGGPLWVLVDPASPGRTPWLVRVDLPSVGPE